MQNKDLEKLEDSIAENDNLIINYSFYILMAIASSYGIFWYFMQVYDASLAGIIIFIITSICLYLKNGTQKKHLYKNIMLGLALLYCFMTNIIFFMNIELMISYFCLIPMTSFILNKNKKSISIAWVIVSYIAVIVSSFLSRAYSTLNMFEPEILFYINVLQGVTLMSIAISIVFLYDKNIMKFVSNLSKKNKIITKSRLELRESQKYKDDFFTSINHELRTPMNAIKGISEILINTENKDEKLQTYYESLNYSSNHLLSIINDLLDLSKINDEKLVINHNQFEIRPSIKQVIEIVQYSIEDKNLAFELIINKAVAAYYTGDIFRIKQVLVNLLSNAIKFTNSGKVSLDISITEKEAKKYLQFSVKDTGIGIEDDLQKNIFNKFFQVNSNYSKNNNGSGLGLSITKKLVNLMQGNLWFESKKGVGTSFHFTIPAQPVSIEKRIKAENDDEIIAFFKALKVYNILLVDDDKMNLLVAENLLKQSIPNAKINTVESGEEAINFLESNSAIDIILMDIQMPGINGIDTSRIIKSTAAHSDTNIIALTASSCTLEDVQQFIKAGMVDYMTKPFERIALLKMLKKYL